MDFWLLQGDCIEEMRALGDESVDAIVCDPPYGLSREPDISEVLTHWLAGDDYEHRGGGFMGKSWDSFVPGPAVWREALRVLKPGGHLLAFAGSRTSDLMGIAIRMAGFEIRDSIMWLYGSGFPKSLDVSKAIDKAAGAEREDLGESTTHHGGGANNVYAQDEWTKENFSKKKARITAPATPEAEQWDGWGTALKPAHEPIVVARKPLIGTVAENVLEHGTGGINIDACRLGERDRTDYRLGDSVRTRGAVFGEPSPSADFDSNKGRWPANVVLDEEAAKMLDEQSGNRPGFFSQDDNGTAQGLSGSVYGNAAGTLSGRREGFNDQGGASRFFYTAKTSRAERNAGLEGFASKPLSWSSGEKSPGTFQSDGTERESPNHHPTVKPINLMRWLVRLVTPPGGTVLDPFTGSGSTGCAALLEGFDFIGCEREPEYVVIAEARVAFWAQHAGREVVDVLKAEARALKVAAADARRGQGSLTAEAA